MIKSVVRDKSNRQAISWGLHLGQRWGAWTQSIWQLGYGQLLHQLPIARDAAVRILEIGCGRGDHLMRFAGHFVNAQLVGLEAALPTVVEAQQRTQPYSNRIDVYHSIYEGVGPPMMASFDVLLLPYQLSQTATWQTQLEQAYHDLRPGGIIAVMDYYKDPIGIVQRKFFHRKPLANTLLPVLEARFAPLSVDVYHAFAGLWQYFSFVGIKPYD